MNRSELASNIGDRKSLVLNICAMVGAAAFACLSYTTTHRTGDPPVEVLWRFHVHRISKDLIRIFLPILVSAVVPCTTPFNKPAAEMAVKVSTAIPLTIVCTPLVISFFSGALVPTVFAWNRKLFWGFTKTIWGFAPGPLLATGWFLVVNAEPERCLLFIVVCRAKLRNALEASILTSCKLCSSIKIVVDLGLVPRG